jgi:hypothetical protein
MVWRTADRNLKILQPSPHFAMVREIAEAYTAHTLKTKVESNANGIPPEKKTESPWSLLGFFITRSTAESRALCLIESTPG